MSINQSYVADMNNSIKNLIKNAIKVSAKKPAFAKFVIKYFSWQKKAEQLRAEGLKSGYAIPPFLIASITHRCNLNCKGCYAKINHSSEKEELTDDKWFEIFEEAKALGLSFILLAGGEPFLRMGLLEKAGKIPEIVFPIFTNGTYINESAVHILEKNRNLIPIVSIEGLENDTDTRRGLGIYQKTLSAMEAFNNKDIFFGTSITVTRNNYELVTSQDFVNSLVNYGCKVIFYVEYVPFNENTKELEVTDSQRKGLLDRLDILRKDYSALFIAFPGDEGKLGGCLSSGRGFAHISASGDLEPCPFSPYSDVNLKDTSLKDALQSRFLRAIRESGEQLSETEHGCALFNKRDWVFSLLNK